MLLYVGGHPLVRWYGLMYVVGIVVGLTVAIPYARTRGLSEDDVWAAFWPAAIAGLLGARLYYVLQSDPLSYLGQPWRVFATWEGGMAFYGAIFGGVLAIAFGYSLGQSFIFFARDNLVLFFGLKQAQITALLVLLACAPLIWLLRHLRPGNPDPGGSPSRRARSATNRTG